MTRTELTAFIKKYNIRIPKDHPDNLAIEATIIKKNPSIVTILKANKQEIMSIIREEQAEQERAIEERKAKIASIEGLDIIRNARDDMRRWQEEFDKSFENVGGFGVREKPEYDFEEMERKYPRAAAYLKAEAYENASHYAKSAAGKEAKEKILNGEDYEKVIEEMEAKWRSHCSEHIWD